METFDFCERVGWIPEQPNTKQQLQHSPPRTVVPISSFNELAVQHNLNAFAT
jgi:hypothetical protein